MSNDFDCEKCVCEGVCLSVAGDAEMPKDSCEYYHPAEGKAVPLAQVEKIVNDELKDYEIIRDQILSKLRK